MGEAVAILRNYERQTGDILKCGDLHHGTLQEKLIPSDYDIKGQVSTTILKLSLTSLYCYQAIPIYILNSPLLICEIGNLAKVF